MSTFYGQGIFDNPGTGIQTVLGPDVKPRTALFPIVYFDDFTDGWGYEAGDADNTGKFSETANLGQWLVSLVDGGTDAGHVVACTDAALGGWLTLTTNDADNDALHLQLNGEAFKLAADKQMVVETRMKITDASDSDWLIGLAATDTDPLTAVTDGVYFRCADSTGDIDAVTEKDSSETLTDTGSDLADDTFVVLRAEIDGTAKVSFYVDGVLKATHATDLPDDQPLTPSVSIRVDNGSGGAETMVIDYIYCAAER